MYIFQYKHPGSLSKVKKLKDSHKTKKSTDDLTSPYVNTQSKLSFAQSNKISKTKIIVGISQK